jgi:hypothetical protein
LLLVFYEVTYRKYALKQGNRIGVHFIKYDIQGCIFKICRNFTYEAVGQQFEKIVAQKINVILFFDIGFFKYFFRVLHEASSSWLKYLYNFQ